MSEELSYPHCDSLILHLPGTCKYCDMYPERQEERIELGIAFSNEDPEGKTQCYSTYLRPAEDRDKWYGNVPQPYGEDDEH